MDRQEKFDKLLAKFIEHVEAHQPFISTVSYMYVKTQIMILKRLSHSYLIDELRADTDVKRFYRDTLGIVDLPVKLEDMAKKSQHFINALIYNYDAITASS